MYTAELETVQSEALGESKLSTLLAQGHFSGDTPIQLTQMTKGPAPGVHDKFLEGYAFTLPPVQPIRCATCRKLNRKMSGSW